MKKSSFTITCLLVLVFRSVAQGQGPTPKFEIGVHYSFLDFLEAAPFRKGASGIGAQVTYNFNKHVASEADVDYFQDRVFGFEDSKGWGWGFLVLQVRDDVVEMCVG